MHLDATIWRLEVQTGTELRPREKPRQSERDMIAVMAMATSAAGGTIPPEVRRRLSRG